MAFINTILFLVLFSLSNVNHARGEEIFTTDALDIAITEAILQSEHLVMQSQDGRTQAMVCYGLGSLESRLTLINNEVTQMGSKSPADLNNLSKQLKSKIRVIASYCDETIHTNLKTGNPRMLVNELWTIRDLLDRVVARLQRMKDLFNGKKLH